MVSTGNPFLEYPAIFWQLISAPWGNLDVAWGVIPMYMSLVLAELYEPKPSPKNAVQGGANLLWAGIDWGRVSLMPLLVIVLDQWYSTPRSDRWGGGLGFLTPIFEGANPIIVTTTLCTILLGITSIVMGVGRKRKKMARLFRYARFSCYVCIMLYPLQTQIIEWNRYGWNAVIAIGIFAVPVCLFLALMFQVVLRIK